MPVERFAEILADDKAHEIKAVLVTQNETATGVTSDVPGVRAAMDAAGHPAMLFVDGVSSIASIDFRMDEWGVDVAVSGSQKGFMLPTGLAIVAVSQKALAAHKTAKLQRCYFDFADMIAANKNGYFPYTPATTLLRGLRCSVDLLLEEGLENVFARHHRLAEAVRRGVAAWGLKLCAKAPKWHSDTVSAIYVPPHIDSTKMVHHAYHAYNLSMGIGLSKVAGRVFRIGHLGALNELMVLTALAGAEMALHDFGADIQLGSGVGAAQRYLAAGPVEQTHRRLSSDRVETAGLKRARRYSTAASGSTPILRMARSHFDLVVPVEHDLRVGRRQEPAIALDLGVELAGVPAGIAQRQHAALGPGAGRDRAQHVDRGGEREPLVDHHRAVLDIVRRMQDEAAARLDRAADMDRRVVAAGLGLDAELADHGREGHLARPPG